MNVLARFVSRQTMDEPAPSSKDIFYGYLAHVGLCCLYTSFAIGLVQFISPAATGSGVPEVIGYLNGIRVAGT